VPVPVLGAGVKLLGVDITKQLGGLLGGIPGLGNLGKPNKNPGRLASNERAYQLAISDPQAIFENQGITGLAFLLAKSPKTNGGQGGWATDLAQQDAWKKYQAAKTYLAQNPGGAPAISLGGVANTLQEKLPEGAKQAIDDTAKALGTTSQTVTWIALALGAVLVLKALRS
jgi:hypothetical protein